MERILPAGVLAIVAVLATCPAGAARASCVASAPALVWSYPTEGAADVPTDAVIAAIPGLGNTVSVELDDVELLASQPWHYGPVIVHPAAMEPDTSHRLRFTIVRPDDGASVVFEVRFTTGSGPWSGSDAIPTVGNVYYEYSQGMVTTAECQAVVAAQECFDTGNPQRNVLKTSDPGDAIALLARRADGEQLPGEITPVYAVSPCTEPIYVVNWGQGGGSGCYEVGVMRPTGAVVWSEPWCEQVALGGLGSCSGRARTGTDAGLPLLVPLLLVAWRIARRRSA